MKLFSVVCLIAFSWATHAAPIPATSSSVLADTTKGTLFHGFGFRLTTVEKNWKATASSEESIFKTIRLEPITASIDKENTASLSIRMDQLADTLTLESYAKKWMRDYPSYGFQILGTKILPLGGGRAMLVDLLQKQKNRQLRQVIFQKEKKVAVVTCLDTKENFSSTLVSCNRMIRSFEWTDNSPALSNPSTPVKR